MKISEFVTVDADLQIKVGGHAAEDEGVAEADVGATVVNHQEAGVKHLNIIIIFFSPVNTQLII